MRTLKFYGRSDDTFGEYGVTGNDYDNCGSKKPIRYLVRNQDGGIIVTGQYSRNHNGCWDIGVSMTDEDKFPKWDMRLSLSGYTPILEIDIPWDFHLKCLERENEN